MPEGSAMSLETAGLAQIPATPPHPQQRPALGRVWIGRWGLPSSSGPEDEEDDACEKCHEQAQGDPRPSHGGSLDPEAC